MDLQKDQMNENFSGLVQKFMMDNNTRARLATYFDEQPLTKETAIKVADAIEEAKEHLVYLAMNILNYEDQKANRTGALRQDANESLLEIIESNFDEIVKEAFPREMKDEVSR